MNQRTIYLLLTGLEQQAITNNLWNQLQEELKNASQEEAEKLWGQYILNNHAILKLLFDYSVVFDIHLTIGA